MARSRRITVKLSLPMEVSLDVLAARHGLSVGTIAFMRLREALQRTSDTPEVQAIVRERKALNDRADWAHDQEMTAEQMKLEGIAEQ